MSSLVPGASRAAIYEQGYRRYEGERLGVPSSVRSLALHSALRALGLRRTVWAKLLPIATVIIAYLPAAVFVGMAAFIPERIRNSIDLIPHYADYFGFISAAVVLFIAIVGPEVLCTDRRTGMLGLYLASPLTRNTYLLAKVLAVLPVLGLVTLGPQLLLLIGRTMVDAGPGNVTEFLSLLLRVVASGLVVAALYTAIAMAIASLTDRRAVAAAGIILVLLVTSAVTGTLVEGLHANQNLYLLNVFTLPFELVQRIYGEVGTDPGLSSLATGSLVGAFFAWVLAGAGVVLWRYRRLQVTR